MRVMVIVKATKNSEAGKMPSEKLLAEMGKFNEELVEGGRHAGRRRAPPEQQGQARALLRRQEDRHRRAVRRDQGARRRLLDLAGEVDGRGGRVGAALPRSDAGRGVGDRDPPGLRGRGLRQGAHAGAAARKEERLRARARGAARSRRATRRRASAIDERARPRAQAIEAVWRIESARLIGGLVRMVRDVGLAEDLAQEALVAALERWPETGIPDNPGAWLMTTAKNRAIDQLRRRQMLERKHGVARRRRHPAPARPDLEAALDEDVGDDLLRLVLIACHPVLSTEARVALTLRLLGGLTTEEIARAFLVPEPTIAQRIVRAKRTLAEATRAVRGAARRGALGAAALGARGRLPRLQRGLRRDARRRLDAHRAVRRRAAPGAHPRRARPRTRPRSTGSSR